MVDLLPGGVGAGPPAGADVEVEVARVGHDPQDLPRLPGHLAVVQSLVIFLQISWQIFDPLNNRLCRYLNMFFVG